MENWACFFLHCITPLHNGAGQGLGSIDRPILRERTTNYPIVQADTIKGALKAAAKRNSSIWNGAEVESAFGKGETGGNQGALILKEASLFAFPVRSLAGTFAWITSRLILARFFRWLGEAGLGSLNSALKIQNLLAITHMLDSIATAAIGPEHTDTGDPKKSFNDSAVRLNGNGKYCLEGLILDPVQDQKQRKAHGEAVTAFADILFSDIYWQEFFRQRFILLPPDAFDHLIQTATEVRSNIEIGEGGVTKDGSLRYTEFLPAETILISLAHLDNTVLSKEASSDLLWGKCIKLFESSFQLGADESKGKGVVQARYWAADISKTMPNSNVGGKK